MTPQEKLKAVEELLVQVKQMRDNQKNSWLYNKLDFAAGEIEDSIKWCKEDGIEENASCYFNEILGE